MLLTLIECCFRYTPNYIFCRCSPFGPFFWIFKLYHNWVQELILAWLLPPFHLVIWMRQDLNPQPLDGESSLLTNRWEFTPNDVLVLISHSTRCIYLCLDTSHTLSLFFTAKKIWWVNKKLLSLYFSIKFVLCSQKKVTRHTKN